MLILNKQTWAERSDEAEEQGNLSVANAIRRNQYLKLFSTFYYSHTEIADCGNAYQQGSGYFLGAGNNMGDGDYCFTKSYCCGNIVQNGGTILSAYRSDNALGR